ncbi:hypothetical protein CXB51_014858 [Gossypium anomalum]|uniref:Transposase-associated domain-containing protein n=1 Tax=Gossypium anomalum TaxID=47600 RepID=A0A8J6D1K5_9ROSI|nr:hypothetical protein CXB51_014858 [Gossypium anomalum]
MILYPCKKCGNINWHIREVVYEHLIVDGFIQGYKKWIFHRECTPRRTSSAINPAYPHNAYHQSIREDDMEGMLWDPFNMCSHGLQSFSPKTIASDGCDIDGNDFTKTGRSVPDEEPNGEAAKLYKLLNKMNEELYEGLKNSKISFCIRLFHLKCLGEWIGNPFTLLLEFLRDMFSFAKIPHSCKDMKKLIKDLSLGYNKIHSCPNDCMLYWGDRKNQQSCHVCGKSHWMNKNTGYVNEDEGKTAESMSWHHDQQTDNGLLRHPADSLAWKSFDSKFLSFASDPRNWICMKQSSFILSMIIPGEKGPENDIDIYMQPPIEELKQLSAGVETYDVLIKENFYLRATLLWTINDFQAYAKLSSWSTKGRYACPCCAVQTCSKWLYNGKKLGHRRWLDGNHRFRFQRTLLDGTEEFREAPKKTIGSKILFMLKDINFSYGKMNQSPNTQTRKRPREAYVGDVDRRLMMNLMKRMILMRRTYGKKIFF